MAYHGRTPQSVLDAPASEAVVVHPTLGPNRKDRRHFYTQPNRKRVFIPKKYQEMTRNVPYLKPGEAA